MQENTVTIRPEEALQVGIEVLKRAGASEENARIQVDLLLEAELRGRSSHGLLRLPRIVERIRSGVIDPLTQGSFTWRGEALLEVDGLRGMGPVVAFAALKHACARATKTGISACVIRNNNHIGMLALYAERVASQGQAIIALSTSEALVHPWGGRQAMLGTNPIAIGVPALPNPFVLDMATGLISMGQIHDYAHRQLPLQPGWALDAQGNPTTDAVAAKAGAIAPFGQAKGYALGLAFEVLVGSLTASALGRDVQGTLDSVNVCNKGDIFIVIETASSDMIGNVSAYLEALRACAPADPASPVVVPGDGAQKRRTKNMEQGLSVAADVWSTLRTLAT